ncbi:hypothetical protein BKA83DRAFT_3171854 [Pisolithus microcarpus]|nr:hypothetical protein BKA83DRAFT_3171854 [Pisolithus microcarpus]
MCNCQGHVNCHMSFLCSDSQIFTVGLWPYSLDHIECYNQRFAHQVPPISHHVKSLTIPTFSTTMQYSKQCIAENGIGAILVFEYLYFLMQVKDERNDLQEDMNLAVEEYKSSGIHAKVNKLIQEAFQNHDDDVEILCPILVKIAQQNQLSKMLSGRG